MADGSALLTDSDLEAWKDWHLMLLRSPSELHEVIVREGRVAPHTDPELKRKPQCRAKLVRDMSLRGLVSFGAPSEATVGVFVVPKKLGKQRLIVDTRPVNQHFRRPWNCVLPTPVSWAGLQLPLDSAYHMAQTDVNTAFYRILAPSGMSEYFILPSVSTRLLLLSCVKVPDHLRHLTDVSPQLQVFAMGVSWAPKFCQKMVKSCVRAAGFLRRTQHYVLSHPCTFRYVRIFHFAKCVHSVAPSYMCKSPRSFATLDRRVSTTSGLCNGCFLGAQILSEDGEELRSGSWVSSADAMLMDRHRAPGWEGDFRRCWLAVF